MVPASTIQYFHFTVLVYREGTMEARRISSRTKLADLFLSSLLPSHLIKKETPAAAAEKKRDSQPISQPLGFTLVHLKT